MDSYDTTDPVSRFAQSLLDCGAHLDDSYSPGRPALYQHAYAERDPRDPLYMEALAWAKTQPIFAVWLASRDEVAVGEMTEQQTIEAALADMVAERALALLGEQSCDRLTALAPQMADALTALTTMHDDGVPINEPEQRTAYDLGEQLLKTGAAAGAS